MADRARMQTLALATTALGQGVVVLARGRRHPALQVAGPQLLRLRRLVQPCSTSAYRTNGFGAGLPPRPDNEGKWASCGRCWPTRPWSRRRPTSAAARGARRRAAGDPAQHPAVPPRQRPAGAAAGVASRAAARPRRPGVIVMRDRRHRRPGHRPAAEGPGRRVQRPRGDHPDGGRDGGAAVRAAPGAGRRQRPGGQGPSYDRPAGTFTVPARTVAVFVQRVG